MNRILTRAVLLLLFFGVGFFSCNKDLDVAPTHFVPINQMWKTKNDARSALFATYGLMRAALADNNAYLAYGELRAGDFSGISNSDLNAAVTSNLNATSTTLESWKSWRRFYAVIAQANLCTEKLAVVHENDFRYTDDELALDLANVRFLRALAYFYLVRIWGDVPLVTSASEGGFLPVQRVDKQRILDYALQETEAVADHLPWQYNGNFPEQQGNYWDQQPGYWNGIIATKATAYALMAHIAAWEGDYLSSANYTAMIMNNKSSGGYDFVSTDDLTNSQGGVFLGQAADIILALPFNKDFQESSKTGHIEAWTLAAPYINRQVPELYVPNDTILSIFSEQGDERFSVNENGTSAGNYFTSFGNPVPIFSKIRELSTSGDHPLENYQSAIVIFRYEEIVLLRAESLLFLGRTDEAVQLLNSVRSHRGLAELDGSEGPLDEAILAERRRELLGEGWRWYDLIRFNKLSQYTKLTSQEVKQGAWLWPISKEILRDAPGMNQNAFWTH